MSLFLFQSLSLAQAYDLEGGCDAQLSFPNSFPFELKVSRGCVEGGVESGNGRAGSSEGYETRRCFADRSPLARDFRPELLFGSKDGDFLLRDGDLISSIGEGRAVSVDRLSCCPGRRRT